MRDPFSQKEVSFLQLDKWQHLNSRLRVGFTTRMEGLSESPYESFNMGLHVSDEHRTVIKNRNKLAEELAIPLEDWVSGEQTHETTIKEIGCKDKGKGSVSINTAIEKTDGLLTNQKGILCTAFFADCVPLYFFDQLTGYIGIAHAGWRGTINEIAKEMAEKLFLKGVNPKNLLVAIGPCISQKHYEVDTFIVDQLEEESRNLSTIKTDKSHYLLDLKQLNINILLQVGVLLENIDVTSFCTYINKDLFYSYRRDGGKTGRMLGFIGYHNK